MEIYTLTKKLKLASGVYKECMKWLYNKKYFQVIKKVL